MGLVGNRRRHPGLPGSKFCREIIRRWMDHGPRDKRCASKSTTAQTGFKFHATADYEFEPDGVLNSDPTFTKEESPGYRDEAHRHGKKAACHAFGGEGLRNCVKPALTRSSMRSNSTKPLRT